MENRKSIIWAYWGHEPMDHLKRMGNNRDSIFSLGEWAEPWYNRIHSEEMIEKVAKMGINTIYTHFFKGFGLEHEKDEMENTRKLTEVAHKYDIKVLGYCQLGSLYYETAMDEIPNLSKMVRVNKDGSIGTWGSVYYRWSPCFNSRLFIEYMKKVIEYGVKHVKLDGFHFDNSYNQACYCENCQQKFRDFLEKNIANPREVFGISSFKNVKIPPNKNSGEFHDPLYLWWLKYRSELCARTHEELFSFVKSISNNKALVLHNPAFPREGRYVNEIGFEPSLSPKTCDIIFAENNCFIQAEEEVTTQIEAFKFGQKFRYKVFDSSWPSDMNGRHRHPESKEEIMRFACQSMVFGNICGSQWIVRSTKKGNMARIDIPGQMDILTNIFSYFVENKYLYDEKVKPHNYIKLLYHPFNCMASPEIGLKAFRNICRKLISDAFPFSFTVEEDILALEGDQVLIIPELKYLTESLYLNILEAAKKGCKILIIGDFAVYNENGRELDSNNMLVELEQHRNVFFIKSKAAIIESELTNILKQLTESKSANIEPHGMLIETCMDEQGRLLVHIINPNNKKIIENVKIQISEGFIKKYYENVKVYSPESTKLKNYKICNNYIDISLNNLKTMSTIVLD